VRWFKLAEINREVVMTISEQDQFEVKYIARCMGDVPYKDAKEFMEERRLDYTYSDDHIAECWSLELAGEPW
jgi:hypothetical protein